MIDKAKKISLLLGDILVMYAALFVTLSLRYQSLPKAGVWQQNFLPFTWLFMIWLLVFYINGLFEMAASKNDIEFYNKILRNVFINYAIAAAYFYVLNHRLFDIKPQAIFLIYVAVYLIIFGLWRYAYNELVQRPTLLRNVLVIGMKDETRDLIAEIQKKPQLGYRIAAIVHEGYRKDYNFPGIKTYDTSVGLKKIIREEDVSVVVTGLDPRGNPKLVQSLFETLALKVQILDLPLFYERLTGKIPVTAVGHIWFLENLAESEKTLYETLKRLQDIVIAILGLVLTAPLVPFIALVIKLSGTGPVLFRQVRVGLLGKPFNAIKFRSMIVGAEQEGQPQWAQKNDPRRTGFGKILRKVRLDEIPQLLNVLKGEMSLIGPRPERPEFVRNLQTMIPFYNERHLVKPGLTGWAQINFQYGASTGDALKKLQYDLFYVKNRSLALDIGIILKTLNIILTGKGL